MKKFPFYHQLDAMDCGPSCLRMVAKFHGKTYSIDKLRDMCYISKEGVSLLAISDAAEKMGFVTNGVEITFGQLNEIQLPCIVHWKQEHFVVVYKITRSKVYVADPAIGLIDYTHSDFKKCWLSSVSEGEETGIALILEPGNDFYNYSDIKEPKKSLASALILLKPHSRLISYMVLIFFTGSIIQLIFPFLTQSIVDIGINTVDIGFIYLIVICQFILIIAKVIADLIRSWIVVQLSSRFSISLISNFLMKLLNMPLGFFDTKLTGDLLQRIYDQKRIDNFLTSHSLNILFSAFSLVMLSLVLFIYSKLIFVVFIVGNILFFLWISLFLKKRKILDYKKFSYLSENQSTLIEIITGVQDIIINNAEKQKRWHWESLQAKIFKMNLRVLKLDQFQQTGSVIINESKNLLIIAISASLVLQGQMSLGMMLAIQFIIGQLSAPIEQMLQFINSYQEAKISFERFSEISQKDGEDSLKGETISDLPANNSIYLNNVSFKYEGPESPYALRDVNLIIERNKVTAIVGTSGSGKTTLMKLFLGYYPPSDGDIKIGNDINLQLINPKFWRSNCGAVLQEGFVFSESIAKNIALGEEKIDTKKLLRASKIACIDEFVNDLPLGYNTKIGIDGHGLSQGQKQRILIARAVYKNPEYLFLDEATNSLDANNEKAIVDNLADFYKGRTVVVVAHRLSTVKNADQIIVLEKGQVIEKGNHSELVSLKGSYYNLIKNQLELGI